ncbi:hypothetical protein CAPTEDRAFT_187547 [Capitella teleta]|uniref:LRRCT domain-containing protein n=1 Tax=Capitella teleta TaxID=283909 RepID=R7UDN2_CAPTE|nr:hypothetical protein CAPTEDRAFT_187547 [Capitella teleta]|eukprot:ELU04094.1 hypothetical protein CAPTEDRAFT_187547 [Capitella teleta]
MPDARMLCFWVALCCGFVPFILGDIPANFTDQSLLEVPKNISVATTHLYLDHNYIHTLRKDGLAHLLNLQYLSVQYNQLSIIEKHAFRGTSLNKIVVSNNQLRVFPYLLDISDTLTSFRIVNNGLRVIKEEDLQGLNNLEKLFLSNNDIYKVPDIINILPSLYHLDFANLNMECCDKVFALTFFTNETLDVRLMPCSSPPELVGEIWWNIDPEAINKPCAVYEICVCFI